MARFRLVGMLILLSCMVIGQAVNCQAMDYRPADSRLQILNFTMDRCEPCRAMQPVLAKLIIEGWQIRQVDVAKEPQLAAQFKLQSAPTLVILSGGREVDRVVGAIAYNKLLNRFEAASRAAGATNALSNTPGNALADSAAAQLLAPQFNAPPNSAPQPLAQRSAAPANQPVFDATMVRGQSPGPADVPDLDVDNERMLEFVKDLPEPPTSPVTARTSPTSTAQFPNFQSSQLQQPNVQPSNIQLASSSTNIGRAAVQSQGRSAVANAPQFDPVARAQQATVRIRIEDANSIAFGTGTVIHIHEGLALVLTCGHMFRDLGQNAQMSIDVFDKTGHISNVPAQVVSHSTEKGDIGLMEFRCPFPITPVPIAKRAPAMGDAAFSFGCDRGADPTRRDTQVKRINRYLGPANVEIHGAPVVGRSGGGLFNAQGQLIGVCNAADAEDDEGIYAALPVIDQHVAALRLESLPSDDDVVTAPNPVQFASATSNAGRMTPVQTAQATLPQSSLPPSATQVRCVIRDAQGKETALLIERPSQELVEMLKQSAAR